MFNAIGVALAWGCVFLLVVAVGGLRLLGELLKLLAVVALGCVAILVVVGCGPSPAPEVVEPPPPKCEFVPFGKTWVKKCDDPPERIHLPTECAPYYNDGTGRWAECMGVGPKSSITLYVQSIHLFL